MKNSNPKPPAGLSKDAKRWWKALTDEYVFESSDALMILETVLQSFDRWLQAKQILDADGLVIPDRFQQKKAHPAVLIERDAKMAMLRGLKQLGLDVVPPGPTGRPPGR